MRKNDRYERMVWHSSENGFNLIQKLMDSSRWVEVIVEQGMWVRMYFMYLSSVIGTQNLLGNRMDTNL